MEEPTDEVLLQLFHLGNESALGTLFDRYGKPAYSLAFRMPGDVQSWLDDPTTNFGWMIVGDESRAKATSRFDSKDNTESTEKPMLVVEYTPS